MQYTHGPGLFMRMKTILRLAVALSFPPARLTFAGEELLLQPGARVLTQPALPLSVRTE
jgi:hypothetical protein